MDRNETFSSLSLRRSIVVRMCANAEAWNAVYGLNVFIAQVADFSQAHPAISGNHRDAFEGISRNAAQRPWRLQEFAHLLCCPSATWGFLGEIEVPIPPGIFLNHVST